MTATLSSKKKHLHLRFAFSTVTTILAFVAVGSSLLYIHDWGKQAIPFVEWVCGGSAVLLLLSIIVDSRRP
jgi:quinol-cytochrome oxidoreductase complex cytochrome b subunit